MSISTRITSISISNMSLTMKREVRRNQTTHTLIKTTKILIATKVNMNMAIHMIHVHMELIQVAMRRKVLMVTKANTNTKINRTKTVMIAIKIQMTTVMSIKPYWICIWRITI